MSFKLSRCLKKGWTWVTTARLSGKGLLKAFLTGLPSLIWAQSTNPMDALNFNPPISDSSVVFLEDLFGVVDGVLSGTGSQIMGSMFSIFNAAVLALGGIVIMYILIVGTMNTAQEGEMLGHKWSSIWVPLRATLGLALLLPKSSGYCLIQILVMWVIVQGVGAADKVWDAALGYLNRGGVIVQAQMSTATAMQTNQSAIATGAEVMLAGQVCMIALQQQLEAQRISYNNTKDMNTNICSGTPTGQIAEFCSQPVPDFLTTVNFMQQQNAQMPSNPSTSNVTLFSAPMPYFDSSSIYSSLSGLCGTMKWNSINSLLSAGTQTSLTQPTSTAQQAELESLTMSRPIALQQMYSSLALTAQSMVNNDPQLNNMASSSTSSTSSNFSTIAIQEYGVPYTSTGTQCTSSANNCMGWGVDQTVSPPTATLLTGTEFSAAIEDYNAVMMPTVNLVSELNNASQETSARSFISSSESQGWMTAGSYFFNLVRLNGSATAGANQTDYNTGLNNSQFSTNNLTQPFSSTQSCGNYCAFFNNSMTAANNIVALISGSGVSGVQSGGIPFPTLTTMSSMPVISGAAGTTTYGFINNGAMVQLPGQPGTTPPSLLITMNIQTPSTLFSIPTMNFPCGGIGPFCLGEMLGNLFYNTIIVGFMNFWMVTLSGFFDVIIQTFLYIPLQIFVVIFENGANIITNPGANPIVSLATMGTAYINTAMELWLQLMSLSIILALVPGFLFLIGLIMPLVISWMGVMIAIGFTTAYYVPFVPYLLFTFGVIAWLMAVIEAMVAAPIVAFGITHPEGEGILGKGEQGLMILMNVFLRPALMVIGFIAGFSMCYVSVWVINTGFQTVAGYMTNTSTANAAGYTGWASMYAGFFVILIYTTTYLTAVQKSFTLIYILPDKVLRWIGGQPEATGQEISQWTEEAKGQIKEGGTETAKAGAAMTGKMAGSAKAGYAKLTGSAAESGRAAPSITGTGGSDSTS